VGCAGTDSCCKNGDACCPADKGEGCCPGNAPVCCSNPTFGDWCCPSGSICDDATGGCDTPPSRGRASASNAGLVAGVARADSAADSPHV
jgi:hypothetical protein